MRLVRRRSRWSDREPGFVPRISRSSVAEAGFDRAVWPRASPEAGFVRAVWLRATSEPEFVLRILGSSVAEAEVAPRTSRWSCSALHPTKALFSARLRTPIAARTIRYPEIIGNP